MFTLINNTHASNAIVDPPFSGAAEGGTATVNSKSAAYTYAGGTGGNDFTLTVASPWIIPGIYPKDTFEFRETSGLVDQPRVSRRRVRPSNREPIGTVNYITINGSDGNDRLVVNYNGTGGFFNKTITFNGGNPTSGTGDSLFVTGGSFTDVTLNHSSSSNGSVVLDATTINYTGLEPVTVGVGGANLIVNLTGSADTTNFSVIDAPDVPGGFDPDVVVDDLLIDNTNATHEDDTVLNIHTYSTITINAGAGGDVLSIGALAPYTGSLTVNGDDGTDSVAITGALALNDLVAITSETITLGANISTDGDATAGSITLTGAVVIADGVSVTLDSNGGGTDGAISLSSTLAGNVGAGSENISFDSGGMTTSVTGAVGPDINTLTVTDSSGTTFSSTVSATTVALTNTTGTIQFNGDLTATDLTAAANAYAVSLLGSTNTVTNAVTFNNTGTLTIGDGSDSTTFVAGVTATAPSSINVAGTIAATTGASTITLGDANTGVTITANASIGGTATGTIDLGDATINDGFTLTVGTGIANAINLDAVSGVAANAASNLTINTTGAVTVAEAVGTDIGTLTITNSGGTTFSSTVDAVTVTLTNTTGNIQFTDNLTATTLNTANQAYAVSLTGTTTSITSDTNFLNTGVVTLGNNDDTLTFAGGLATASNATNPSSTSVSGTVRTNGQPMDIGPATLTSTSTLRTDNTVPAGAAMNFGTLAGGGFSVTIHGGTGGNVTLNGALTNLDSVDVSGATIDLNAKLTATGTVHFDATDNITIDAAIDPTMVTLEADDDITISAAVVATDQITVSAGTDTSGSVILNVGGSLLVDNGGNTAAITISTGATSGNVTLTGTTTADDTVMITSVGNINGAGLVTAATIDLDAGTGIGDTTPLSLSSSAITVDSQAGNINVDNAIAATFTTVTTGVGTIAVDNTGAAVFTTVTTSNGSIALSAIGGHLTVGTNVEAGGGANPVSLTTTTSGNVILTGTTTANGAGSSASPVPARSAGAEWSQQPMRD